MGESSFWYRPTRVVPDQRPLNGRCCCCCYLLSRTFNTAAHVAQISTLPLAGKICNRRGILIVSDECEDSKIWSGKAGVFLTETENSTKLPFAVVHS